MGLIFFFAFLLVFVAVTFFVLIRIGAKSSSCTCRRCMPKFKAAERGFELPDKCPDFGVEITPMDQSLTPEEYYRKVWTLVCDNFLYGDRLAEWKTWEHAYDGRLRTFSDAGEAVRVMLAALKDRYSVLHDTGWCLSHAQHQKTRDVAISRMLDAEVGYVKLFTFDAPNVEDEFRKHLGSLSKAKAIVLDLRGNLGGRVSAAIDMLDALVETDSEVHLFSLVGSAEASYHCKLTLDSVVKEGAAEKDEATPKPRRGNLLNGRPLVLLQDERSASASELVAGALRLLKRTLIVGTKSYGKAVAQSLWYLDCGTLFRLTTARVVLSDGTCVDGQGLNPDHFAAANVLLPGDPPLKMALRLARLSVFKQVSTESEIADPPFLQTVR